MFLLEHPGTASLSCEDCAKWLFNQNTGEPHLRGGKLQKRKPGQLPPCRTCPKGSPERGEKLKITRANATTIRLYVRNRAARGCLNDAEREDAWLLRNLGIIDNVMRKYEATQSTAALSLAIERFAEPKR